MVCVSVEVVMIMMRNMAIDAGDTCFTVDAGTRPPIQRYPQNRAAQTKMDSRFATVFVCSVRRRSDDDKLTRFHDVTVLSIIHHTYAIVFHCFHDGMGYSRRRVCAQTLTIRGAQTRLSDSGSHLSNSE